MEYYLRFESVPENEDIEVFNEFRYHYHSGIFSAGEGIMLNQGDILNGIDPHWCNNNGIPSLDRQDRIQHLIESRWHIDQRIYDPFEKVFLLLLSWIDGDVNDF